MRLIGHLKSEPHAKTLADYLTSVDIRNEIEPDADGWAVWIVSEDQLDAGREALNAFLANPTEPRFQGVAKKAAEVVERERADTARFQKRYRTADQVWISASNGALTLVLIAISVIVTMGEFVEATRPYVEYYLFISTVPHGLAAALSHGQIWRLITPIFIHFNLPHIIFDMLMLRTFGAVIENRQGWIPLLVLVVVVGIGSNLGQYYHGGPYFGGMSGVVYGLFGYVWMRGKFDIASRYYVPPGNVATMLIWLVLCYTGIISNVANACHLYGLAIGMAMGCLPILKRYY